MMSFFQDAPGNPDLFLVDAALRAELARRLPASLLALAQARRRQVDQHPRRRVGHRQRAAVGRRAGREQVQQRRLDHPPMLAEPRLVAGRDQPLRRREHPQRLPGRRGPDLVDAAPPRVVRHVLRRLGLGLRRQARQQIRARHPDRRAAGLRERLVPGLTTTDPACFITSGQWMTERTGGSDVGGTETVARPAGVVGGEQRYTLHGVKWFTSATTSEMALTLARIDDGAQAPVAGSRGLSLFCVEIVREPAVGGVSPSSMRASVSAISEVVADVNHLTPCRL